MCKVSLDWGDVHTPYSLGFGSCELCVGIYGMVWDLAAVYLLPGFGPLCLTLSGIQGGGAVR